MKAFALQLAGILQPNQQLAVLDYGLEVETVVGLTGSPSELAISNMPYLATKTLTGKAMKTAFELLTLGANNLLLRPALIMIVTDDVSQDPLVIRQSASRIQAAGGRIVALGLSSANFTEIASITGGRQQDVYAFETFPPQATIALLERLALEAFCEAYGIPFRESTPASTTAAGSGLPAAPHNGGRAAPAAPKTPGANWVTEGALTAVLSVQSASVSNNYVTLIADGTAMSLASLAQLPLLLSRSLTVDDSYSLRALASETTLTASGVIRASLLLATTDAARLQRRLSQPLFPRMLLTVELHEGADQTHQVAAVHLNATDWQQLALQVLVNSPQPTSPATAVQTFFISSTSTTIAFYVNLSPNNFPAGGSQNHNDPHGQGERRRGGPALSTRLDLDLPPAADWLPALQLAADRHELLWAPLASSEDGQGGEPDSVPDQEFSDGSEISVGPKGRQPYFRETLAAVLIGIITGGE